MTLQPNKAKKSILHCDADAALQVVLTQATCCPRLLPLCNHLLRVQAQAPGVVELPTSDTELNNDEMVTPYVLVLQKVPSEGS